MHICYILIALCIVPLNHGMFFKTNKRFYVSAVTTSSMMAPRSLKSMNSEILRPTLKISKTNPQFYGFLSCGISVATLGGIGKSYTNLHQSLIRYEPRPTKQQLQEDERTLKLVNTILYGSLIAQTLLLCRKSVTQVTRKMMQRLKQLA